MSDDQEVEARHDVDLGASGEELSQLDDRALDDDDAASVSDLPPEKQQELLAKYATAIETVFFHHYDAAADYAFGTTLYFQKKELDDIGRELNIPAQNIPDIPYHYRVRGLLPERIRATGNWAIDNPGRSWYAFLLLQNTPHFDLDFDQWQAIAIPNAVPEVVDVLLGNDEQCMLTRILYNRLVDIATGLTCYHIQNHLRSSVPREKGRTQVEVDALYAGIDTHGKVYMIPVEAKSLGDTEMLGRIQVMNMVRLMKEFFPDYESRILAVKALADDSIGIVEFTTGQDERVFDPDALTKTHGGLSRYTLTRPARRTPEIVVPGRAAKSRARKKGKSTGESSPSLFDVDSLG